MYIGPSVFPDEGYRDENYIDQNANILNSLLIITVTEVTDMNQAASVWRASWPEACCPYASWCFAGTQHIRILSHTPLDCGRSDWSSSASSETTRCVVYKRHGPLYTIEPGQLVCDRHPNDWQLVIYWNVRITCGHILLDDDPRTLALSMSTLTAAQISRSTHSLPLGPNNNALPFVATTTQRSWSDILGLYPWNFLAISCHRSHIHILKGTPR